nr:MAG TPA: hypothetical protein [Caudoviricetes sp.]
MYRVQRVPAIVSVFFYFLGSLLRDMKRLSL